MHAAFPRSAFASVRVCTPSSTRPAALASSTPSPSGRCWSDAALFPLHPCRVVGVFYVLLRRVSRRDRAGSNGLHCSVAFVFCRPSCSCPWGRPCLPDCLQPFWRPYLDPSACTMTGPALLGCAVFCVQCSVCCVQRYGAATRQGARATHSQARASYQCSR